jgi:acetyl-CoA synthetase
MTSLRILGTVGEPINPEAWMWYHANVGGGRCPIVDTWWQTETGGHLITPLPGATSTKPGIVLLSRFPASSPTSSTRPVIRSGAARAASS